MLAGVRPARIVLLLLAITTLFRSQDAQKLSRLEKHYIKNINKLLEKDCSLTMGTYQTNRHELAFDCNIIKISDCKFQNFKNCAIYSFQSNTYNTAIKLFISSCSFTKCVTEFFSIDDQSEHYGMNNNASIYFYFGPNFIVDYFDSETNFIKSCSFIDCGPAIYFRGLDYVKRIKASYLAISTAHRPAGLKTGDRFYSAIIFNSGNVEESSCTNWNFTNSKEIFETLAFTLVNYKLNYINVYNVTTIKLLHCSDGTYDCININSIVVEASSQTTIFYSSNLLSLKNTIVICKEPIPNNAYLAYLWSSTPADFYKLYSNINKVNKAYSGKLTLVNDFNLFFFNSYGCSVSMKQNTDKFSPSIEFIKSKTFIHSSEFSRSRIFIPSNIFLSSKTFSCTRNFYDTMDLSNSHSFKATTEFVRTSDFSPTGLIPTNQFTPSKKFTPSNRFTPSDSKYVYFMRLSKQSAFPSKSSPYGILSPAGMASVSTTVILVIIIIGAVLMILYVNEQKKRYVEPELSDQLQIPSDSSDTTEECVISFSYSWDTRSRSDDPFRMDPEYYLANITKI